MLRSEYHNQNCVPVIEAAEQFSGGVLSTPPVRDPALLESILQYAGNVISVCPLCAYGPIPEAKVRKSVNYRRFRELIKEMDKDREKALWYVWQWLDEAKAFGNAHNAEIAQEALILALKEASTFGWWFCQSQD